MIREINIQLLNTLRQMPIAIETWTGTPVPDLRRNRWQLYRENEVNEIVNANNLGKTVVVNGAEQGGKSSLMVEVYYALLAQDKPVFGFSTRNILDDLPTGGGIFNQLMDSLIALSDNYTVLIDNVDYIFTTFEHMKQHLYSGKSYQNSDNEPIFVANCFRLLSLLKEKKFNLIFSLHSDWPESWVDNDRFIVWKELLGAEGHMIELNPCLEPDKTAAYLRLERGIQLPEIILPETKIALSIIPFNFLKNSSVDEILALLKF